MDDQRRLRVHLAAEADEALPLQEVLVLVEADALLPFGKEIRSIGTRVHEKESPFAVLNARMDAGDEDVVNHEVVLPVPANRRPGSHPAELDGLLVKVQSEAGLFGSGGFGTSDEEGEFPWLPDDLIEVVFLPFALHRCPTEAAGHDLRFRIEDLHRLPRGENLVRFGEPQ